MYIFLVRTVQEEGKNISLARTKPAAGGSYTPTAAKQLCRQTGIIELIVVLCDQHQHPKNK
jgi:hypothetical protein